MTSSTTPTRPAAAPPPNGKAARRNALGRIEQAIRRAWGGGRRPSVAKWCNRCIRLDTAVEVRATRLDFTQRPWWQFVVEAIADPDVRSIAIPASTQLGKTLQLIAALLYLAENDPAPMMIVLPDEKSAVEFRDRCYLNAAATIAHGKTTRLKVPKPWRWNNRYIDLGSCRIYLAWSQSRQGLRGRPCRRVFFSEVDVYEGNKTAGDPISQGQQRTKAFQRYLHYAESSPTEEPSQIEQLERQASARYRWHARCPHCDHAQELRFFTPKDGPRKGCGGIAGYTDEGGEPLAATVARQRAHYVCERGCRIDESERMDFITAGSWVLINPPADGGDVDRRRIGVNLWAIHSESQTFGDLAASYCDAHENGKLRDWWGNTLGKAYRNAARVPVWFEVGQRLAAEHPRGNVPAAAWFLTAGCDVQADFSGVRYVIRAWGPQRTSWLVDWGWIDPPPTDEAAELVRGDLRIVGEQVLQQTLPVYGGAINPLGLSRLPVRLLCVDSNHDPRAVHRWLRSLPEEWVRGEGTERVRAIRGDSQLGGVRFQKSVVEKNSRDGQPYEGGMVVWRLAVAEMYPEMCDRLFAPPGRPGSWHVTSDAVTLGKSYLQQICNMTRRVVIKNSGRKVIEWGPRSHQIPVDFFDCEVYAAFAADMVVGDLGWSAEAWAKVIKGQSADGQRPAKPVESLSDR